MAAEALRKEGAFEPTRLFGVTTLDVVRASTFIAHALGGGTDPKQYKMPVIGGHSGGTILPLYSQSEPKVDVDAKTLANVIHSACSPKSRQRAASPLFPLLTMVYQGFSTVATRSSRASREPAARQPAWRTLALDSSRLF